MNIFETKSIFAHSMQLNNLLYRKNAQNYQANLYLKSGLGLIHDSNQIEPLLFSGLAADWETRRLFASYSNRFMWGGDVFNLINNSWRLSFAPILETMEIFILG